MRIRPQDRSVPAHAGKGRGCSFNGWEMIEKAEIQRWLDDARLTHRDAEIPKNSDDVQTQWALVAETKPFPILVAQQGEGYSRIVMQATVTVAALHVEALEALDPDDRDRFLHDLRIHLLNMPVGYQLGFKREDESASGVLADLVFGYNLFEDPPTRAGFFRRVHQIQTAALLGSELLKKMKRFGRWP